MLNKCEPFLSIAPIPIEVRNHGPAIIKTGLWSVFESSQLISTQAKFKETGQEVIGTVSHSNAASVVCG